MIAINRKAKYRPADRFFILASKYRRSTKPVFSTLQSVSSRTTEDRELLIEQLKVIDHLQRLPRGWDGSAAERPNQHSVDRAQSILMHLFRLKFLPDKITPSVENGVGISFIQGDKYADIECFNTGEILAVTSDRQSPPQVWEVEDRPQAITAALRKIRDFISR